VSTIYSDTNEYQVVVNALPSQTATPEALNRIHVRTTSGTMVPISAVTRQEPGLAPTQVIHADQFTAMSLSFNLAEGISMGDATREVERTAREMRLPGNIRIELGGDFRRFQE